MRMDIVLCARSWLGTPYRHQASSKGIGTDCLGLIRGVWRECLGEEPVRAPSYSADWSEATQQEELWRAAKAYLNEVHRDAMVGDVVLFRMRDGMVAKHLGIVASVGQATTFIHAYQGHGVVESHLSTPWRRRVVSLFEFP